MSFLFDHEQKEMSDFLKREIDPSYFYHKELPEAELNRRGQVCCFCDDTAGLSIDAKTGAFKCVVCKTEGNDIIEFTIARDKIQRHEALIILEILYCFS